VYLRTESHQSLFEERTAIFSGEPEPIYRYWLEHIWDRTRPPFVALMLNPSTATHLVGDPTVDRMMRRAIAMRSGSLIVLNAFAYRETDRLKMLKVADPIGPANDDFIVRGIRAAKQSGGVVMVGWGNEGGHRERHLRVVELLQAEGVQSYCLGRCANGQPSHPLYIAASTPLVPWP